MERRGFLRGLFGGVAATGLIVAASPKEIEAFAAPLVKDQPLILDQPTPEVVGIGEHLYNERGELVAWVTSINVTVREVPKDSWRHYVSGPPEVEIRAVGVGPVRWCADTQRPRLGTR